MPRSDTDRTIDLERGPLFRVRAEGKHLEAKGQPFSIRGVTYGSFAARADGALFPETERIAADLIAMTGAGVNTVRTYTLPPEDLLNLAGDLGLRVLIGLDFEDWRYQPSTGRAACKRVLEAGRAAVDAALERCSGRQEVLAISVGNEVPVDVVRAHGIGTIEDGLAELIARIHAADPDMLTTYSNFPTTEFLEIEGQDLFCFNVFLEDPEAFRRYVRHLQVISGDKPVVLTELGLASAPNGERAQADSLTWQLRIVDEAGVAGATVFSWTDEWNVAGSPVEGWGFGLTDENRVPKPALDVVERWADSDVASLRSRWPSVSAIVCAYNAERHIGHCLESLTASDYPDLEIIVVNDGSTDRTAELAGQFEAVRVIDLPPGGLSRARNVGIERSEGEIVAFLDSDAFCHPEWPYHLALSLEDPEVAGTGGPNHPVPHSGFVEAAVAESPGSPREVLVSDDRAEHVPGCNMAFRREALVEIGGFNVAYRTAGDDVDVCWKLLDRGYQIGFSPAAQVYHHRRADVRSYLRQQRGYGRAERMLMPDHAHRFNRLGQARWRGFVYGGPRLLSKLLRPIVYHGTFGSEPYQTVAGRPAERAREWGTALMPLVVVLTAMGFALTPLSLWAGFIGAAGLATIVGFMVAVGAGADIPRWVGRPRVYRALVAALHVAQPCVRTWGRVFSSAPAPSYPPTPWNGDRAAWLQALERSLAARGWRVRTGGIHDRFDLETWRSGLTATRVTTAVLWGWQPVASVRLRIRALAGIVALAPLLLAPSLPRPAAAAGACLVALIGVDAWRARRAVKKALQETTDAKGESP